MGRYKSVDDSLWDIFMEKPWWVPPLMASIAYIFFAYILPAMFDALPVLKPFGVIPRFFAPLVLFLILVIGLFANIRKYRTGMLLDRQKGWNTINNLTWRQFEEIVATAYRRQGYKVVETGGGGADGGVDVILHSDGDKALVQCKHWRSSQVGVKLVRELHGITHSREHAGSRGIFVTFGTYTSDAIKFAKENGIELVNRKALLEMVESVQRSRPAQAVPDTSSESTPACPLCGSPMRLKTARQGNHIGSKFWGCTRYPACRGIRNTDCGKV